jgi:hypothetical protein
VEIAENYEKTGVQAEIAAYDGLKYDLVRT